MPVTTKRLASSRAERCREQLGERGGNARYAVRFGDPPLAARTGLLCHLYYVLQSVLAAQLLGVRACCQEKVIERLQC